jgi:hypothetical protein
MAVGTAGSASLATRIPHLSTGSVLENNIFHSQKVLAESAFFIAKNCGGACMSLRYLLLVCTAAE